MPSQFIKEYEALKKELKVANIHAAPRITSVVVNVGVGKHRDNAPFIEAVKHDVAAITGQKAQERLARKAVAGFNIRQGNLVGLRVTLRGKRMEDFVKRFVHVTLPRVRDFRGLPLTALDGHGNLNVGLREQLSFAEVHPEKTDAIFGLQVTFVTTARDNTEGEALFRVLGFPLTQEVDAGEPVPSMTRSSTKKK